MKRLLIPILFVWIASFADTISAQTSAYYRITAGANITVPAGTLAQSIYVYATAGVVLASDYNLVNASTPPVGFRWRVYYNVTTVTLGIRTCNFFGTLINGVDADQVGAIDFQVITDHTGTRTVVSTRVPDHINSSPPSPTISGDGIIDGTIDYTTKLVQLPAGQFLLGDFSNTAQAQALSGAITCDDAGITTLGASTVSNSNISAGAAIARTKIASGTASHVVINDGSGVLSSEATLSASRGGLGTSASSSTGFVTFSTGTATIGTITDNKELDVSFETGEVGDFKFRMDFAGTVTGAYAYAYKAIAATDDATITLKNNAGTTMTSGVITFTAADPRGTAYTVSPSGNNTFISGDILTATTAKATAGGKVILTITYTRNN